MTRLKLLNKGWEGVPFSFQHRIAVSLLELVDIDGHLGQCDAGEMRYRPVRIEATQNKTDNAPYHNERHYLQYSLHDDSSFPIFH